MQKDPDYLTKYRIRIYDPKGNELQPQQIDWITDEATKYMLRQDPSDGNSLGFVRINFPNPDSGYVHDTPYKSLFNKDERFDSSGCVRIQDVRELVVWLLRDTPGQTRESTPNSEVANDSTSSLRSRSPCTGSTSRLGQAEMVSSGSATTSTTWMPLVRSRLTSRSCRSNCLRHCGLARPSYMNVIGFGPLPR